VPFDESLLTPFIGYLELGMYPDANDELEKLPSDVKAHPIVLLARLELLVEMERWEDGVILGASLIKLWPQEHEFRFKTAYCLHELKRTKEARETLATAPADLLKTALFFYNMACYETQLGNLGEALLLLESCFAKDKNWRAEALEDPDLELLWDSL
jgi:tetratricopeptide (TPR) repeat protein